jgi:hypothetical protein
MSIGTHWLLLSSLFPIDSVDQSTNCSITRPIASCRLPAASCPLFFERPFGDADIPARPDCMWIELVQTR